MNHMHLMTLATNRSHPRAGFCLPCVCLRILKSSQKRVSHQACKSEKAPPGLSLPHHAWCPSRRLLRSTTECREDHRRATCSQQVQIEAVGREFFTAATSRDADQRDALFPLPRRFGRGGKRHRHRRERRARNGQETASTSEALRRD